MAGASEAYHEPLDQLSEKTRNMHRALVSLQEELEAVDWYRQRADAADDEELRNVLLHNMREEVEHACMILEWLRRNSADFDKQMTTYLFTARPLLQVEEEKERAEASAEAGEAKPAVQRRSLRTSTVGTLKVSDR